MLEAVRNCTRTFFGSILLFCQFFFNTLKLVFSFGQNQDLWTATESDLPQGKYQYSTEFKDLVFDMMAFNHKDRPTPKQIREHPWMKLGENPKSSAAERKLSQEQLKNDVIRDMTKLKRSRVVQ